MSRDFILIGGEKNAVSEPCKMKIVFMQMHIPDPRTNKRIDVAKRVGDVSVICVRRKTQDIWEPVHKDVPHYTFPLDIPTSKEPVKRFFVSQRFNRLTIKKLNEISPDIIYCGGIDILSLACRYKQKHPKCRIFYEVADLRECFISESTSIKGKVERVALDVLEKRCFKYVEHLCLTSMKFYDVHYRYLIEKEKVIYTPNVPDVSAFSDYHKKAGGTFTVGFIGGIRYLNQMKMLVDATEEVGCNLLFAGAGGTTSDFREISEYCKGKSWVQFTGKYDYKKQIAGLYGSVDCVYAVYDADNPNVKIALPNKLYESVYCELPLIVAKNTYLSEIVSQYQIGVCVSHKSKEELCEALRQLMVPYQYENMVENCRKNKDELVTNDWITNLEKSFKEIL